MTPIVNDKHKYILLYSAKSACTSLRLLYLSIHGDELSAQEHAKLRHYHNLNEIHPLDTERDYSDYFTFTLTRNPYTRIVSAYIDQFVYFRNKGVQAMLEQYPPASMPINFIEFLQYLQTVPDEDRDSHFQAQASFPYAGQIVTRHDWKYRWFGHLSEFSFGIRYSGDISKFNHHVTKVYRRVFKRNPAMLDKALREIAQLKKRNSSFYGKRNYPDAATMQESLLKEMVFPPKPQDFYNSEEVKTLVETIYAEDFAKFGYRVGDIPHKSASPEIDLIPDDFDWQMYIRLSPEFPSREVYDERSVVRHYLNFGRHEKEHPRAWKLEAPAGFDWRRYLSLHDDLGRAGIDSEEGAIEHYITYGIREQREI